MSIILSFCMYLGPPHHYILQLVKCLHLKGTDVDMVCNATNDAVANVSVQINWYNGTELIKPDGKYVMVNNVQNNATGQVHSVLSFNPVNYTNDGEYVCRAFNHPLLFTESRIKTEC